MGTANGSRLLCLALGFLVMTILPMDALAERVYFAGYNGGFYIRADADGMEMRLGGALDADYRGYAEGERADNRFDIRKARLIFRGQVTRWFRYGLEYEFQGAETNNLLEAWGEFASEDLHALRMGQFKEPFSLEWQSADKAQWFSERSMGNSLVPPRDVGVMVHGSFLSRGAYYAIGAFNGDANDGAARGSQEDAPELAGRFVLKPFRALDVPILSQAQVGLSASTARIDTVNVDLKVKTTGMVGLSRNVYVLSHDTKFGVLQDVDSRTRWGMDGAWSYGPLTLTGEYMHLTYSGLTTASHPKSDASFSDWYVSAALCLTGEELSLTGGVVNPIMSTSFYDPAEHTYGAVLLAARTDHFKGDKDWITPNVYVSAEQVDSNSIALTWYFLPLCRAIIDYTRSEFSDDIKVRVNPDGSIDYIDTENVITLRLSIEI